MLRVPYDHDEIIEFVLGSQRQLTGTINSDDPGQIFWTIRIECREARYRNLAAKTEERLREQQEHAEFLSGEACHAEISGLSFSISSWRELAGQRSDQEYASDELHPIMPDIPATFYYEAQHFAANKNRIAIGKRNGTIFDFSWKFDAEESEDYIIQGVQIKTNIAFRELRVYFEDPAARSAEKALAIATRFAEADDLRPVRAFRDHWLVIPIRADVA